MIKRNFMKKNIRLTESELKKIVRKVINEEKKKKIIKESKVQVDISELIGIAEMAASMRPNAKWNDYFSSFVKIFRNMDLTEEQGELIFDWFTENFPSAPNDRLSDYIPSLAGRSSEWYAEGGFQHSKNWDDSPEDAKWYGDDNSDDLYDNPDNF
jgi:hypothetical protein